MYLSFGTVRTREKHSLFLLIFIHLLIFTYPLASKITHVHHDELHHHEHTASAAFCQPEDDCPVCDFEFYSFIATPQFKVNAPFITVSVVNSMAPNAKFAAPIYYFSLRAPPVA